METGEKVDHVHRDLTYVQHAKTEKRVHQQQQQQRYVILSNMCNTHWGMKLVNCTDQTGQSISSETRSFCMCFFFSFHDFPLPCSLSPCSYAMQIIRAGFVWYFDHFDWTNIGHSYRWKCIYMSHMHVWLSMQLASLLTDYWEKKSRFFPSLHQNEWVVCAVCVMKTCAYRMMLFFFLIMSCTRFIWQHKMVRMHKHGLAWQAGQVLANNLVIA